MKKDIPKTRKNIRMQGQIPHVETKGGTPHQQTWWPLHHRGLAHTVHMPLDSNVEYALCLGKILERWTSLEAELSKCLAALLDGNEDAARAIIYSLNATGVRISMVRAVARELLPEGPEKRGFIYLLEKINDLQKQRNEFVHGEYWHGSEGEALDLVMIRPMNSDTFTLRPIKLSELQAHVRECEEREFQLSLARAEHPERNVPQMHTLRSRALSRYRMRHA